MSTMAKDNDAIARMRAANPISTMELSTALSDEEMREAMDAAILAGESPIGSVAPRQKGRAGFRRRPAFDRRASRRGPFAALGGLACGAAVALVVLLAGTPGGGNQPEFAAAALRVAEANPRLLVTEPGWVIIGAGEFEADEGDVNFIDGNHDLSIQWYPARMYRQHLRDGAQVSAPEISELLGHTATTIHAGGTHEYTTIISPIGSVFVEISAGLSHSAYEAVLDSLREVDVSTWLEAMPPNVVLSSGRPAAVAQLLRGVPVPPGFDAAALQHGGRVSHPYALAVEVGDAVSCGWVESWLAAKKAGDAARAQEAVEAMAGALHWPLMDVLRSGSGSGWAPNILAAARELKRGHLNNGPVGTFGDGDGKEYELGPTWAMNIECESHTWRRLLSSR